jgi:phage pi2 protein 07
MQANDLDSFMEILDAVAEQYNKTLSDGLKELYWQGLKDYDFKAVSMALTRHIRNTENGQFMPKIADIVKMLEGSSQDTAYSAWTKVDKAVRRVGTYSTVIFDDPLIHKVISDMGGWVQLGHKQENEWPFVAKEFENRYRGFKSRNEVPEYPTALIGMFEAHNSKEGYKSQPPVLIGDKEKALLVAKGGTELPQLQITHQETVFDGVAKLLLK